MSNNSYLRVLSLNVYGQIYYVITVAFCTLIHIHLELVMLTRYLPRSIVTKRLAAGKIVSPFQTEALMTSRRMHTRTPVTYVQILHVTHASLTRNLTKKMSPGRSKRDEAKSKEQREIIRYRRIRIEDSSDISQVIIFSKGFYKCWSTFPSYCTRRIHFAIKNSYGICFSESAIGRKWSFFFAEVIISPQEENFHSESYACSLVE